MKNYSSLIRKICCFIFIIVFSFSCFVACAPGVNSGGGSGGGASSGGQTGGGGSTGGGSGGSDEGGSDSGGGSGSGGVSAEEIASIQNPCMDFADLYSGVYLLISADSDTKFYDDVTQSQKTFTDLLDRQFVAISEQIVYGLTVVYGATSEETKQMTAYSVSLSKPKMLGTAETSTDMCKQHTGNNIGLDCADCLAKIAGLRGPFENNPFKFENAIAGGYSYDESTYAFTTTLQTTKKWSAGTSLSVDSIKNAIAGVFADGNLNSSLSYNDALKKIDHLGITKPVAVDDKKSLSEKDMIVKYILDYVIGSKNVQEDNSIRTSFGAENAIIQIGDAGTDMFTGNVNKHYYKGYEKVVSYIVEKALTIGLDGSYHDENGVFSSNTQTMFPEMPRVSVKYYSSSYFRENVEGKSFFEDLENMEDMTEEEMEDFVEQEGEGASATYYNIMKSNEKILSMILLPKMSEDALNTQKEYLTGIYGEDFVNSWNEIEYIWAEGIAFGLNGKKGKEPFIVKPQFFVKAQGQVVLDDYVSNQYYDSSLPTDVQENIFQKSETEIYVQYHNSLTDEIIGEYGAFSYYGLLDKQAEPKRLAPYDGVSLVNESGKYNDAYFVSGKQKVWANLFDVQPRYDKENLSTFVAGINSTFKGGGNFVQINFEYYDLAGKSIDTPEINFFYFNGYA